jgi:hypothetical protein
MGDLNYGFLFPLKVSGRDRQGGLGNSTEENNLARTHGVGF